MPEKSRADSFFLARSRMQNLFGSRPGWRIRDAEVRESRRFAANKASLFEMLRISYRAPGAGRSVGPSKLRWLSRRDGTAVRYARKFVEEAKSEGLVKAAIERAGLRGAVVAPVQ